MRKTQLVTTIIVMAGMLLFSGCADRYDRAPQQPPTSKTYSIYKNQKPGGFRITQMHGVIDMISGLMR
ncbi:hypothetical protein ACQCN2_07080 [Brevibacillus ginsengisoli]|uniref:hypothetical protein n=1 Tax=Brevibacillus ginsengisoli TaxID=363854 RepID=UPI003CEF2FCC